MLCCRTVWNKRWNSVHGLKIEGTPQFVTVLEDNVFELTVTEDSGKGMINNGEWLNIECIVDSVCMAGQRYC
ncbi:MAG: hypothetical protein R2883_00190 [Caldisericia bacterium]